MREDQSGKILSMPYRIALDQYPSLPDFFHSMALDIPAEGEEQALGAILWQLDQFRLEELGLDYKRLPEELILFLLNAERIRTGIDVSSVTIIGGCDKNGNPENITLTMKKGDIIAVVGPTGAGKSRLLADIEWMAQGDTPTGRKILINGEEPCAAWRYSAEHKLVAQLSQNMNFVMDLTVGEFIELHARSRMVRDAEEKKSRILTEANRLAGEPLSLDTPVTALSGGQSRALMIADTAFLSTSPIVLIDEIENAGIDRRKAVDLLIKKEKIVMISTHDPVLALTASMRLVIENGSISAIIETSGEERECLTLLEELNGRLMKSREKLRKGERISFTDL